VLELRVVGVLGGSACAAEEGLFVSVAEEEDHNGETGPDEQGEEGKGNSSLQRLVPREVDAGGASPGSEHDGACEPEQRGERVNATDDDAVVEGRYDDGDDDGSDQDQDRPDGGEERVGELRRDDARVAGKKVAVFLAEEGGIVGSEAENKDGEEGGDSAQSKELDFHGEGDVW